MEAQDAAWRSATTAAAERTSKGTGLLGLRDRAEAEGGTLIVVSPPGRGMITATLPLHP